MLYKYRNKLSGGPVFAVALMILSLDLIFIGRNIGLDKIFSAPYISSLGYEYVLSYLGYSIHFIWFNFVGLCVIIHISGAWIIFNNIKTIPLNIKNNLEKISNKTYSIYLFHFSIQLMFSSIFNYLKMKNMTIFIIIFSFLISYLIGIFVENLKQPLKEMMLNVFEAGRRKLVQRLPQP